jgi:NAD(P)H-hydrate epimerase
MREVRDLPVLPARPVDAHKGDFGHVLIVGGSLGLTGAPVMAARSALRAGAGLVTCACPGHVAPIVAGHLVEAMTWPLPIDAAGCIAAEGERMLRSAAQRFQALVIGPGLGRHERTVAFVRTFLDGLTSPVVIDADALLALGEGCRMAPTFVATPHPGEFGRMTGTSSAEVQAARRERACAFAAANPGVLVLKGHETIVAAADRLYVNDTGNPGMATGGSGDVLSGVIGALLGQGFDPFDAAQLGVWLHGRAGDLARDRVGEDSLIASDIIRALPRACRERKASGA